MGGSSGIERRCVLLMTTVQWVVEQFWKVWAVLFIQSASLSLNMLFVLFTDAPREKTRGGGAETVWRKGKNKLRG